MGCFIMPKGIPNKSCIPGFKNLAAETIQEEKLSDCQTAQRFGIRHKQVQGWKRIYLAEGAESFAAERPQEQDKECRHIFSGFHEILYFRTGKMNSCASAFEIGAY